MSLGTFAIDPKQSPQLSLRSGRFKRLSALLGREVHTDLQLVGAVTQGVSPTAIDNLTREGLTRKELDFVINPRTLTHRLAKHESLTCEESERVVRVANLLVLAEQVFRTPEQATKWMRKPLQRLGGMTPLEASRTEQGAKLVETTLTQIDEGYFA